MFKKPALRFSHPATFIGTWFGVGLFSKAPGTMGSIAALPFAWLIQSHFGGRGLLIASFSAFLVGCEACRIYLRYTDVKDPKEMVIDEVSGQWLLLAFMPFTPLSYFLALIAFRFFDILKPWPISSADKNIHGGFGVMFDDTLAAIYPLFLLTLLALAAHALGLHLHLGMFFNTNIFRYLDA